MPNIKFNEQKYKRIKWLDDTACCWHTCIWDLIKVEHRSCNVSQRSFPFNRRFHINKQFQNLFTYKQVLTIYKNKLQLTISLKNMNFGIGSKMTIIIRKVNKLKLIMSSLHIKLIYTFSLKNHYSLSCHYTHW